MNTPSTREVRLTSALLDERDRRCAAEDEAAALRRKVEVLNAKLVELSSPHRDVIALREAYRRGYGTGYEAARSGRPRPADPALVARGEFGHALREAA